MEILESLCKVHGPSGEEHRVKEFIFDYVKNNQKHWKNNPKVVFGTEMQDCLMLIFGKPRTAIISHMDTVGFTVRYDNQLVPIGSPNASDGQTLVSNDSLGPIECKLKINKSGNAFYEFGRVIERGTSLVYKCDFRNTNKYIQSCHLDNRLGVYSALKLAEEIEDGIIAFSSWEEHGGGSIPYLIKYIYERYHVRQALICDLTWVTDGIKHGEGTVISMRDINIPRKKFVDRIIHIAESSGISYQLEVEGAGSSDAREIQQSPYPVDWCFVGPPEEHAHSPDELVYKNDLNATISLYQLLMDKL